MNATASTPFFCRYCVGSCHSLHVGRRCNEQRYEEPHEQCTCTVTVPTPSPTDQQTGAVTDQGEARLIEAAKHRGLPADVDAWAKNLAADSVKAGEIEYAVTDQQREKAFRECLERLKMASLIEYGTDRILRQLFNAGYEAATKGQGR